eukprot:PITA_29731
MVEIKKQVAESSTKKPYRNFKKPESKPPNVISYVDSDPEEEEEEETITPSDELEEEKVVECHGMWDFILPNSNTEAEQEAFRVTTRSKSTPEPVQANSKKRSAGTNTTKEKSLVQELLSHFLAFNISPIPRSQNAATDLLANVASKLLPSEDFSLDRFSVELIFRPSVPDNITNWRVFNHDEDILHFLTSDKSYNDQIIDENDHDLQMKEKHEENSIPKPVVKLEDLYDIKDRFKHVTNSKIQSSTLRFELINLGTKHKPQNINLGLGISEQERTTFIRLLKKNKHVFAWNYDDLKTYDTSIIQHTIPMLLEQKPVQQKLRKIHPNLESQIKTELNKLLKEKIIFPVWHSNWVSNMVPVRKKNGEIRICIDFRNLNKASQKDNFPLPTMEQILHSVACSELMSFLDGFSGYNQVLVHPNDRLKTTFRTKWGTYAYHKMPFWTY